ncbi:DUF3108 domain-containing protein [Paraperlucidibaca sp.]|jgi:hypothetical protein|uniref:DUF3108 domain-containing protein n=1 Tax=Paraperlucidibaca sp. TaxID=2708021 RepID=UPI003988CD75|tara:strand:+ start:2608 stop:3555 length:948 start_codon:yes stop_codon:yes gene_type:complete
MRTNPRLRLAINVIVGILLGIFISQMLSGCSDELPLAPAPSAGIAGEASAEVETINGSKTAARISPTQANVVTTISPAAVATTSSATSPTAVAPAAVSVTAPVAAPVVSNTMPLPQTKEHYHLSWDGKLEGDATRSLSCKATQCRYETHASVVGLASFSEISDFQWAHGQVEFQRYERTLQLLFKQVARIEKQADGSIRSERRGKVYQYAGKAGLVDILNIEVQLRADRLANRAPKASYPLADSKGISAISLHREADETLTVAGKARHSEVYVRQDGKRKTTLWLDPAQAFLPLQIIHQDGAETYRMIWLGDAAK